MTLERLVGALNRFEGHSVMAANDDKLMIKRNLINRQRGMWLSDRQVGHLIDILDRKVKVEDVQDYRQGTGNWG